MVLPYYQRGDLYEVIKRGKFSESRAGGYFAQLLDGLGHLKRHGLAHRDLSPENIVLGPFGRVLIIDLGLCLALGQAPDGRYLKLPPVRALGKPSYIAPELYRRRASDGFSADLWSLGVILYVMLTGVPLYSSPSDPAFSLLERGETVTLLDHYSSLGFVIPALAQDVLVRVLDPDYSERATVEEVQSHEWVQQHRHSCYDHHNEAFSVAQGP